MSNISQATFTLGMYSPFIVTMYNLLVFFLVASISCTSDSLVCFANQITDGERSDRVIATKWDAAFVLHDGVPTKDDIARLKENVPKQEVGRVSFKELTWEPMVLVMLSILVSIIKTERALSDNFTEQGKRK